MLHTDGLWSPTEPRGQGARVSSQFAALGLPVSIGHGFSSPLRLRPRKRGGETWGGTLRGLEGAAGRPVRLTGKQGDGSAGVWGLWLGVSLVACHLPLEIGTLSLLWYVTLI